MLTFAPGAATVRPLAGAQDDATSIRAARSILTSSSVDDGIDRLYPLLLQHHVFPAVVGNLETAGGDLTRLSVSGERYRSTWPLGRLLPPMPQSGGRVSLAAIQSGVRSHLALLDSLAVDLTRRCTHRRLVVLSGCALRARYPSYRRLHHDLDLFTPDATTGLGVLDELWRMGFVLVRLRTSGLGGRLVYAKLLRSTDTGHQLHVDLIAGGRPAGPGMRPPFVLRSLADRAATAQIQGETVLVPSPEDMLVLLAAKVRRKGTLTLRDAGDARVLLTHEGSTLDRRYVSMLADHHRIGGALARLASEVEAVDGRPMVPDGIQPDLQHRPAGSSRSLRDEAHLAMDRSVAWLLKARLHLARVGLERTLRKADGGRTRRLMVGAVLDPKGSIVMPTDGASDERRDERDVPRG